MLLKEWCLRHHWAYYQMVQFVVVHPVWQLNRVQDQALFCELLL